MPRGPLTSNLWIYCPGAGQVSSWATGKQAGKKAGANSQVWGSLPRTLVPSSCPPASNIFKQVFIAQWPPSPPTLQWRHYDVFFFRFCSVCHPYSYHQRRWTSWYDFSRWDECSLKRSFDFQNSSIKGYWGIPIFKLVTTPSESN